MIVFIDAMTFSIVTLCLPLHVLFANMIVLSGTITFSKATLCLLAVSFFFV
jgi:hypothetical protein